MIHRDLIIPSSSVAELCRQHRIRRMSLFGSVLTEEFGATSDVDVLIEFEPGQTPGLRFFGIELELSRLFGRQVDLNTPQTLSRYFRDAVLASAQPIYGPEA